MKRLQAFAAFSLLLLPYTAVNAETIEDRVTRLERKLSNQTLLEMLDRIDALQREVQELRGLTEEQTYELESLKRRQRELYLDVDRRLSSVEREGPATVITTTPEAQPVTTLTQPAETPTAETATTTVAEEKPTVEQLNEERAAYQEAFNKLRELRYEQAIESFREFLSKYPSGKYAHIAQYWLGEANYARREFTQAAKDYQALIDGFASSPKVIEAKLKIGYCYYELQNYPEAQKQLEALILQHPDTTESGQAQQLIKSMRASNKL